MSLPQIAQILFCSKADADNSGFPQRSFFHLQQSSVQPAVKESGELHHAA